MLLDTIRWTCAAFQLALLSGCAEPSAPPSIILVSLDTTRADALSLYGYGRATTPRLDRLAERGLVFEQCATVSGNTLLSHASMLTGLFPIAHGATWRDSGTALHPNYQTLAEDLREAGYETAGFTAHGQWLNAEFGIDQGFDTFVSSSDGADTVLARAAKWLDARDRTKPYFLFIHLFDVHSAPHGRPYGTEKPFLGRWTSGYDGPFQDWEQQEPDGSAFLNAVMDGAITLSSADLQYLRDQYDEGLAETDEKLGRFLEELQAEHADQAWIAITADHGEEFMEHGKLLHGLPFDVVMRVPLILLPPRATPDRLGEPRRVAQQVRLVDLRPTFLSLAGLGAANLCQGTDLVPWLEGRTKVCPSGPAPVGNTALRLNGMKLIRGKRGGLFSLRRDPGETTDLAAHPALQKLRRTMAAVLTDMTKESKDWRRRVMAGATDIVPEADAKRRDYLRQLGYLGD